jgi:predicted DNA-binding protein with PD1-like motif
MEGFLYFFWHNQVISSLRLFPVDITGLRMEERRFRVKACEGKMGRVFILRLEDGDLIPDCLEKFAEKNEISVGHVILIGGVESGEIVTGPRHADEMPPEPILWPVNGAHEVAGIGVLAPGEDNKPILHIHAALGRSGDTISGCLRPGVTTWLVGEVIIYEILGVDVMRLKDEQSGFELLEVGTRDAPCANDREGKTPLS